MATGPLTLSGHHLLALAIQSALIVAAAGLLLALTTREAHACSCAPRPTPTEALEYAPFVVSGVVTGKHQFDDSFNRIATNHEGQSNKEGIPPIARTIYEFKVYNVWKGELNEIIYLYVLEARDTCGNWRSSVGQEWLLYGPPSPCGRGTWLQSAQQDIIELGEGRSPIPGTSEPIPEVLQETMRALKPGVDQSTTPEMMYPTPSKTHGNEAPTSTPQVATTDSHA